jgi:hypothetical protein
MTFVIDLRFRYDGSVFYLLRVLLLIKLGSFSIRALVKKLTSVLLRGCAYDMLVLPLSKVCYLDGR